LSDSTPLPAPTTRVLRSPGSRLILWRAPARMIRSVPHRPARAHPLALAVLAGLAAAAGCAPRAPPPDLSLDPAVLLEQVRAAQARVVRVQGQARVHVQSREFTGTVGQFVAAEKPDRLHLELLDFFGNPVVVMVAGNGRFALWDGRQKIFYRGAPTAENLARIVPLAIRAEDLVTILCGSAPLLDGTPEAALPGRGVVTLDLKADAVVQRLEIGPRAAIASSRMARAEDGDLPGAVNLHFDVFHTLGGTRFPNEVALRSTPPAKVRLDLTWREVDLNGSIDPALFRLEPPRGARIVDLPDRGPAAAAGAPLGGRSAARSTARRE
jgi:hypothetical protein